MKATMKQHQQQRQEILSGTSNTIVVMRMTKIMMTIMIILSCPNNNNEGVVSALHHILVHHLSTSNHISRSRSRSSSYSITPACIREQPTTMTMLMTTSNNNAAAATTTTTVDVNNNNINSNKNNENDNDDKTKKKPNRTKKKQSKTKKKQKGDDDDEKEKGIFTKSFYKEFNELLKYRRDVRRFYTNDRKPVNEKLIYTLLNNAFTTSPSVGLSEPWKIIHVKSQIAKTNVINNFEKCNKDALQGYNTNDEGGNTTTTTTTKAELYSKLKLSGLHDAPIHIAIYCNDSTTKGSGLGIQTMPEMKHYSCVCGIMSFWLLARSKGIGIGWVSILDPKQLVIDLNLENVVVSSSVVDDWTLIGYLCVGYPNLEDDDINDNYDDNDIKTNDITGNCDDDSVVDSGTTDIITSSKRSSTPELELYGWEKRRRGGRKQKQKQKEHSPVSVSASASIHNGSSSNNNYLDDDFEDSFDDDHDDDDDDDDDDDEDDDDEDDDNDSYDERELPIIIV